MSGELEILKQIAHSLESIDIGLKILVGVVCFSSTYFFKYYEFRGRK